MTDILYLLPNVPIHLPNNFPQKTTLRLKKYLNAFYGFSPEKWNNHLQVFQKIGLLKKSIKDRNKSKKDYLHWKLSDIEYWETYYILSLLPPVPTSKLSYNFYKYI
jgi:hypothetical protein